MHLCFQIFLKGGQTNFINTVLEGKVKVKRKKTKFLRVQRNVCIIVNVLHAERSFVSL